MRLHLVRSRLVLRAVAAVLFCLFLFSPVQGVTHNSVQHAPDLIQAMETLNADFAALVKAALLASVEEPTGDTPFETIEMRARALAATAKRLPGVEEIRGDASSIAFARRLEGAAVDLAGAAKERKLGAVAKALFRAHEACVGCHAESRF